MMIFNRRFVLAKTTLGSFAILVILVTFSAIATIAEKVAKMAEVTTIVANRRQSGCENG